MPVITGKAHGVDTLEAAEIFFKDWNAGRRQYHPERIAQLIAELVNLTRELAYENTGLKMLGPGFERAELDELLKQQGIAVQ